MVDALPAAATAPEPLAALGLQANGSRLGAVGGLVGGTHTNRVDRLSKCLFRIVSAGGRNALVGTAQGLR